MASGLVASSGNCYSRRKSCLSSNMVALCQRSEDRDRKTTCEQVYPVKFDSGRIEIDGVQYRSTKVKKSELERLLQLLSAEPLGFPRSSVHFIGFQRILPCL